ncbi:hypothetical protein DID78_05340 [Candidatus Marinamargulisbacteria bacterium SCGC AG-343-D04]|nr:hypothetical protein DID78_05340 [Candidatus Marinamargulisbacteria bacterium SCGC AG-343-D04]
MDLGFNSSFGKNSTGNDDSISRYFGSPAATSGSDDPLSSMDGFGQSFTDIFADQLNGQTIDAELDSTLELLDAKRDLSHVSVEDASQQIFDAIEKLLSGFNELFGKFSSSIQQDPIQDLDRLVTGAKQLFDSSENPAVLENLGETWKKLKKRQSPLFHSVHAYFLHISISYTCSDKGALDGAEASKGAYSEETYFSMISIVGSFEDSPEKKELVTVLDEVSEEVEDNQVSELMVDSSNDISLDSTVQAA